MSDVCPDIPDSDDPFLNLSNDIAGHLGIHYRRILNAPSLEDAYRILTPKKLSAVIRGKFPGGVSSVVNSVEFAHLIRTFLPKIADAFDELDKRAIGSVFGVAGLLSSFGPVARISPETSSQFAVSRVYNDHRRQLDCLPRIMPQPCTRSHVHDRPTSWLVVRECWPQRHGPYSRKRLPR